MSLPYDSETTQACYLSLDSPLAYLEFPQSVKKIATMDANESTTIPELAHHPGSTSYSSCITSCQALDIESTGELVGGEEFTESIPDDQSDNFSSSFELESLSNTDCSDWSSSFDIEEYDLQEIGAVRRPESEISTRWHHADDCYQIVEEQRITIEELMKNLQEVKLELDIHRKRVEADEISYKDALGARALVVLLRRVEMATDSLYHEFLRFIPKFFKNEVTQKYRSYQKLYSSFTDPYFITMIPNLPLGSIETILLAHFNKFTILTDNRGEILMEIVDYYKSIVIDDDLTSSDSVLEIRAKTLDGREHTSACYRYLREVFNSEKGLNWKQVETDKVLLKLGYPAAYQ